MNQEQQTCGQNECCEGAGRLGACILGGLGAFLVIAAMVGVVRHFTQPTPIGVEKTALREKNLRDVRGAGTEVLNNYAWQDATKGVVRLPISEAMKLMEKEYKNPAAARASLLARSEKANAVPPKAPEKPSQFE